MRLTRFRVGEREELDRTVDRRELNKLNEQNGITAILPSPRPSPQGEGVAEDVSAPRAIVFINWRCGALKVGLIFLTLYGSVS